MGYEICAACGAAIASDAESCPRCGTTHAARPAGVSPAPDALPAGGTSGLRVGDRIATISSPKGLANTVSDGLVSGIREEEGERLIQISAPISPGSSGGPVFDAAGRVVGIATLQMSEGQNLNF